MRALFLCVIVASAALALPRSADAQPVPLQPPAEAGTQRFEKELRGTFGGTRVRYRAVVEEAILRNEEGRPAASVFTTSYIRSDRRAGESRPVIFVFNGGPGSASTWLHMGLVGPRRIAFEDEVRPETAPPFVIEDNPASPLDVADIVLVDPPGTGFSRILPDGDERQFYGVTQDARATVRIIEAWVRRHNRWNSPRYLLGESYGTIRAAATARLLAGGPFATGHMEGLTLNGVILLGQAMDQTGDRDRSALTALPSLAATAWYHGKAGQERPLEDHIAEAERFAADELVRAYFRGSRLSPAERQAIAERLSALTGLSRETIMREGLRLVPSEFARTLLAVQGRQVGAYDSRFTLPLAASAGDPVADDPAMAQYVPGYVAAVNHYLRNELGVTLAEPYQSIAFRTVNARWDYGFGPGVPGNRNYATDLATAMRRNPALRLLVGTGYYDLVTTLGAADHVVAHSGIPLERTTFRHYESGHMPYLGEESRTKVAGDIRAFVTGKRLASE